MDLLVHGGAGSAPEDPDVRQSTLGEAAAVGRDCGTPTEAVAAAVRHLESAPRFNAGVGGAVQSDGRIRTDAGLMTSDGQAGAAGGMPGVEHAIDVAEAVRMETPHVLVVGERAIVFAESVGVETDCNLWTERTRERWRAVDPPDGASTREQVAWVRERFGGDHPRGDDPTDHDTVGAVATDGQRLAAATSTGGRWFALAGRVGDVPQVGGGFYATERAAVSTTGDGEEIARFGLARRVALAIEDGDRPQHAADRVLRGFDAETGGGAGVIAIRADGRTGRAYNTEAMQTSAASH
jgi:isoaspartyl peptidase/L-asparaginase-like protein (Ntn-hydrolase superfamily)